MSVRRFSPLVCALALLAGAQTIRAQEPAAPQSVTREQLQSAIDKLGDLDYAATLTLLEKWAGVEVKGASA